MLSPGPIWLETIRFAETASSEENQMSIFPTKILLATDGSSEDELASNVASELAKSTNSELHLLTVIPEQPDLDYMIRRYPFRNADEALQAFEQEAQRTLEEQAKRLKQLGGPVEQKHLKVGEPEARAIVELAEDMRAGLIVMGSRGRGGMRRALMGSVSD